MKRLILGFLLFSSIAVAQNGGTIESRFGIGELDLMATSRQRGMGTTSTALTSTTDISLSNPATWSSVDELRLEGGLSYEYLTSSRTDAAVAIGSIKGFSFVFPLEESLRLRLGSSVLPASRTDYRTLGEGSLDGQDYSVTYEGSGGISLFRVGLSGEPLPNVRLGAAYQYYFGTIEQISALRWDNGLWYNARQTRATSHSGSGLLLGLHYNGIRGLSLGATVRPATSLSATRNLTIEYSTADSTLSGSSGTQDIPLAFSVGAAWQATDALLIAVDYSRQDWSEATIFDGKQTGLGETYKVAVGAEWYPYKNDLDARTLSRTAFRIGFYLQQPYMAFDNETTQEYFITTGAGFPIFGSNRGDVALEYGWRGSESSTLGAQSILRLSFSVSVGESWFVRKAD